MTPRAHARPEAPARRGYLALVSGLLVLGASVLVAPAASAAPEGDEPSGLQITSAGDGLENMAPGEVRTVTTAVANPTPLDAQVSPVATVIGDVDGVAEHILLSVDVCPTAWAPSQDDSLTCAGGESTAVLTDWTVLGSASTSPSFRVDTGDTVHLRTLVKLTDDAPQGVQGLRGELSYDFSSVEAPPRDGAAVTTTTSRQDDLPRTGAQVMGLLAGGSLLVGAGALLVALARHRRASEPV